MHVESERKSKLFRVSFYMREYWNKRHWLKISGYATTYLNINESESKRNERRWRRRRWRWKWWKMSPRRMYTLYFGWLAIYNFFFTASNTIYAEHSISRISVWHGSATLKLMHFSWWTVPCESNQVEKWTKEPRCASNENETAMQNTSTWRTVSLSIFLHKSHLKLYEHIFSSTFDWYHKYRARVRCHSRATPEQHVVIHIAYGSFFSMVFVYCFISGEKIFVPQSHLKCTFACATNER